MKTSRQITQQVEAQFAALENWRNAYEVDLQRAVDAVATVTAQIKQPEARAKAAAIAANLQAAREFEDWQARHWASKK